MNDFSLACDPCVGKDHRNVLLWSPGESLSPNCAVCRWVSKKQPCEIHHHIDCKEIAEWTSLHCILFCFGESLGDCVYRFNIKNSSASLDQVVQFYGVDIVLCLVFAKTAAKLRVTLCFRLSKYPTFTAWPHSCSHFHSYSLFSFSHMLLIHILLIHVSFKITLNSFWGRIVGWIWDLESKCFISSPCFYHLTDCTTLGKLLNKNFFFTEFFEDQRR